MKKVARIFIYCWMVFLGRVLFEALSPKSLPAGNMLTIETMMSATSSKILGSVSPKFRLIWVAGGLVSIGVCIFWLRLLKKRELRNPVTLPLGFLLFIWGTFTAGFMTALDILRLSIQRTWNVPLVGERLHTYEHPVLEAISTLTLAALVLLMSYFFFSQEEGER